MPRRKPPRTCIVDNCPEEPYRRGRCKSHHDESEREMARRNVAIDALNKSTVDDRLLDDLALREELYRLQKRWRDAQRVLESRRGTAAMPLDEAQYAVDWCITLAQEIVDADAALRSGQEVSYLFTHWRKEVWEQLDNLEAGLMSNGHPRDPAGT
jgi:hypothetical protein